MLIGLHLVVKLQEFPVVLSNNEVYFIFHKIFVKKLVFFVMVFCKHDLCSLRSVTIARN